MNTICQSCGMAMSEGQHGTNADGSLSEDYCIYCFQKGQFSKNETMEEMIESCIPFELNDSDCPDEETARKRLMEVIPTLKRWKK